MKSALKGFLLFLAVGSFSCSKTQNAPISTVQASKTTQALTQTPLPKNATDVSAITKSMFTTTFDLRFTCSTEELDQFLKASPVLPDQLESGKRSLLSSMNNESWWQPDRLQNVNGVEAQWTNGSQKVWCNLMAGKNSSDTLVVYASFTIE